MPSLIQLFSTYFAKTTREKASLYSNAGRITIRKGGPALLEATVRGTSQYQVQVKMEDRNVSVSCTCPFYGEGQFCKHVWAAIDFGNRAGYLDSLDTEPRPTLVHRTSEPTTMKAVGWRTNLPTLPDPSETSASTGREFGFFLDPDGASAGSIASLQIAIRRQGKKGGWGPFQPKSIRRADLATMSAEDRPIFEILLGAESNRYAAWNPDNNQRADGFLLTAAHATLLFPRLCATNRFFREATPLRWDSGPAWDLEFDLFKSGSQWNFRGGLRRGGERLEISKPDVLLEGGFIILGDLIAPFRDVRGASGWVATLRRHDAISIPSREIEEFRAAVVERSSTLPIAWPEELKVEEIAMTPVPVLRLASPESATGGHLRATARFAYEKTELSISDPRLRLMEGKRAILRNREFEKQAAATLERLGFESVPPYIDDPGKDNLLVPVPSLPSIVDELLAGGWRVEGAKMTYRRPGAMKISVQSGIDWFDLQGGVDYEGEMVPLPRLLKAVRKGEAFVQLSHGGRGVLPREWLEKMEFLLVAGATEGDAIRYAPSQGALLDALLASEPGVSCDRTFQRFRDQLARFNGIVAKEPPAGFVGELRGYQKEGLGWLEFLQTFGIGGCLADDMGLGKTVQALALLESRKAAKKGPSLVVLPRSLVFNWKAEAARFCPGLRILENVGAVRTRDSKVFENYDIVLTTYGTLRNDAPALKDIRFDYVILDEAQAIKNSGSVTAKAALLLKADHRLAMSGTPIENHIGELWSLFEFLNPGLLGGARVFRDLVGDGRTAAAKSKELIARVLRPFILRRTKEKVAPELPTKLEQTLYCELEPAERKNYDELKEHYRQSLLGKLDDAGLRKSKILVLEALLRLRQAACHPGLIDKGRTGETSTKIELLLERIREIVDEGHKVLVFSQFTSLLSIVKRRLDEEKFVYEYLDGATRDRKERVERFQADPACPIFLISLKAGGLGLNLTAAEYVFILDPWWNPAVEAQAIDRTHRIGQTRRVFACRIIAKDTVEEKVLELQASKRELAEAIIGADPNLLKSLTRKDLEVLLS